MASHQALNPPRSIQLNSLHTPSPIMTTFVNSPTPDVDSPGTMSSAMGIFLGHGNSTPYPSSPIHPNFESDSSRIPSGTAFALFLLSAIFGLSLFLISLRVAQRIHDHIVKIQTDRQHQQLPDREELEERLQDHEQRAVWRTEREHMFVSTDFSRPRVLDEQERRWREEWEARNLVQTFSAIRNEASESISLDQAGGQGSRNTGENNNSNAEVANADQGHGQNDGLAERGMTRVQEVGGQPPHRRSIERQRAMALWYLEGRPLR
jgi:hypothetical protein